MKALSGFVVVESLEPSDSDNKTSTGIYIRNNSVSDPNVGHYKVLSVGKKENCEIKEGDTVWALSINVSKSENFNNNNLGIIKYDNIMSVD